MFGCLLGSMRGDYGVVRRLAKYYVKPIEGFHHIVSAAAISNSAEDQ